MEWVKQEKRWKHPIKSWCKDIEDGAMSQAINLSNHPAVYGHIALMPDCHEGYGMPIGGVIGCKEAVIPNAVGVDIGCGMGAVKTNIEVKSLTRETIRQVLTLVKKFVPIGKGNSHKSFQKWNGFEEYLDKVDGVPGWYNKRVWDLAQKSLGTLGGGNHFIEMQKDEHGFLWLMIHSGSRNLGYQIANYYNQRALKLNEKEKISLPSKDLAFLNASSSSGKVYLRDMQFALEYAKDNRKRIMDAFQQSIFDILGPAIFENQINIHHNYVCLERHFNVDLWIHRKGATSAKKGEHGIIPGSMGTPSYIVVGLGNIDSFMSCSHGAGRVMGRKEASRRLTIKECDEAVKHVVCDRWNKIRIKKGQKEYDFGEAPQAYKKIEQVIELQKDLINPLVKLRPIGVVKG